MFLEGTYEGEKASLACTISQAYRTLLSGASGHMFGNKPIWLFDPGWPAALDSPGSRAMQHLAELIAARGLVNLVPDFAGAIVSGDGVAAARTRSGGTTLAFVDAGPSQLRVAPRAGATSRRAAWFDPAAGTTTDAGSHDPGAPLALTSPPGGPWLVIIDDVVPVAPGAARGL
jgi:hypothetical protein